MDKIIILKFYNIINKTNHNYIEENNENKYWISDIDKNTSICLEIYELKIMAFDWLVNYCNEKSNRIDIIDDMVNDDFNLENIIELAVENG